MSVGLDLWGIGSSVFGGDFLSSEVAVDVNLKNRFFPIAELGYGSTDTWSDKGIHYKSNAPYFRIGMDYNTLYKKQHGHMLLVVQTCARIPTQNSAHCMEPFIPLWL